MNTLKKSNILAPIAAFFSFFIMGFVDIVGISANYIKNDFHLSAGIAGIIPMMVFLWFAVFSIPTGILMGKAGRKKTVLLSITITCVAMITPFLFYTFYAVLFAFILLGISNTILQVSLNPLIVAMFDKEKTASILTLGQFIKSVSSFFGPIIVGFTASQLGNWKFTFIIFAIVSVISILLLMFSKVEEIGFESKPATYAGTLGLLKNKFILLCFLCVFLIVGFDVALNISIPELLMKHAGMTLKSAGYGNSVYFAAKTAGAFLGTFLLLKIKPMKFLITSLIVALTAYLGLMFIHDVWILRILIFVLSFAGANVFSIIFSLALQRTPTRSNEISALMIMGILGGAVIPFLQGLISDSISFTAALSVVFVCLFLILIFTLNLKKNVQ